MLNKIIEQLGEEFNMQDFITSPAPGNYTLLFKNEINIDLIESATDIYITSKIGACPKEGGEALLAKALEVNLFGESSNHGVVGLDRDGNMLTLSQELDYNIDYKKFKEKIEDFLNVIEFWQGELLNFH